MRALLIALPLLALALIAAMPAQAHGHAYGRQTPTPTFTETPTSTATPTVTATPVPTSTPPPVTPVRVIVLGFADHPATEAYRALLCDQWVPALQAWFIREVGLTFTYTCETDNSQYPIAQVQSAANNTPDGCGEGMYDPAFAAWIFPELGILNTLTPHERDLLLVEAGGGFAATYEGVNAGVSVVGNWQAQWQTTGQNDPCCPTLDPNGIGDCEAVGPTTLGHEILNAFGCNTYTDTGLWYPAVLPDYVKAGLLDPCNSSWLYSP